MSEHTLSASQQDNMMREFSSGLAKLRYELQKNICEIDVLKRDILDNTIAVFNDRLVIFQHGFLQSIATMRGSAPNRTEDLELGCEGRSPLPGAIGGAAGVVAGGTVAGVTISTVHTGFWIFSATHVITLTTVVAGASGLPAHIATGGITIAAGVAGVFAVNKATAGFMRKRIRKRLMVAFDEGIVPKLNSWAEALLNE